MDTLWQDVRFAARTLKHNPGFTLVAVLILALGIGATTAVFSVVNAVLLRPLPYVDASRLVALTSLYRPGTENRKVRVIALTDMEAWRRESRTLASMGAFFFTQLPMRVGQQSYSPVTALMDPEFLPTLGNELAMGTYFDPQSQPGSDSTVIISHALWIEAFGRDPAVIGRALSVDGEPYTVRGVLAADFQFPRSDASYFTKPIGLLIPAYSGRLAQSRQWFGIGRLGAGVSLEQAQAEMQSIAEGISRQKPENEGWSVRLSPLDEETTNDSRQALLIVLGISVVLLLVASTNLMNLFFSRGVARLREMTIRKAVGSTAGRLVRQLLTESLCLAVLGGAAGVLIAMYAIEVLVTLSPVHLPVTQTIGIDATVLAFTSAICIATALAAGLFPALHVSLKADEAVRNPGMRVTAGRGLARVQQGLCVTQMALGVALLAAAGLLAHSLWRLSTVAPGYESDRVLGFDLAVPNDQSMDQRKRFYATALEEIRRIPGVASAGLISFLPPETRAGVFMGLSIDGAPPVERGAAPPTVNTLISSVDYFSTMGMTLMRGRDFSSADTAQSQPVIIVNEALVRRHFPDEDPVGRKIGTGFDGGKPVREIVGVVADTRDRGLGRDPYPTVYIPFPQFALPYGSIALRTQVAPETLIPEIRSRLNKLNPDVPLTDFQTVDQRIYESLEQPRFYTLMAGACAFMAVLFVTLGLYGIVSYSVSRRTSEFGIRMAVGAQQAAILRLVLLQGLRMAAAGAALGVALSVVFTRVLSSLLFQVTPNDPMTLTAAAMLVVAVTLLASYVPARRASRVNPIVALRYE
jgi:putative ABC transport system permease protein